MHDLLIPFGIHRETGDIVEPEDAAMGRACDCLCPGCKAPLLCKHPKQKRDHFAHDSKHKNAKPQQSCPFSSAVAVAMMVRNMAPAFVGKLLGTPSHSVEERCPRCRRSELIEVTHSAYNRIDDASANVSAYGHHFDLKLIVSGFTILVDLVYKGKQSMTINEAELQSEKVALLTLNCDSFSFTTFRRHRKLRFSEAIIRFFLIEGRRAWRFHPRTIVARQQAKQRHQCVHRHTHSPAQRYVHRTKIDNEAVERAPIQSLEIDHEPVQRMDIARPEIKPEAVQNADITRPEKEEVPYRPKEVIEDKTVVRRFECVLCHLSWEHYGKGSWQCPECHSHLYAREIDQF